MKEVIEALDQIARIPGTAIDRNFGQGRQALAEQLLLRNGEAPSPETVTFISDDSREGLTQLADMVMPNQLPQDYIFFLQYSGGLIIQTEACRLGLYGLGPMVLEWYEDVTALNYSSEPSIRSIHIGYSSCVSKVQEPSAVDFILDVGNVVEPYTIFGLGPGYSGVPHPFALRQEDTRDWKKVANSFAEFLAQIAETEGRLDFL